MSTLAVQGRRAARAAWNLVKGASPEARRRRREGDAWAAEAMAALGQMTHELGGRVPLVRSVLWDGIWENPNYWPRLSLVRAALGLEGARETGVLGPWRRDRVAANFRALGIGRLADYAARARVTADHRRRAKALIAASSDPADLFEWNLPHGFPGTLLFDGVLKRQRRPTVWLGDPELPGTIAEALAFIEAADAIVEQAGPELAVLSHALDYEFGALAWAAIRRGVPVLVLYGDFGTARFIRMSRPEDLFIYPGRPSRDAFDGMAPGPKASLAAAGSRYLDARLDGATDDVSAVYAFQKRSATVDRSAILARHGWDPAKPMLAVYGANWFDFPHVTGLTAYRDFLDWMEITLDVAAARGDVNWVFKAHPVDDWYGSQNGATVEDLARAVGRDHVAVVDRAWNGRDLLAAVDGLVCCHSTAGLEAGAMGKPVLVAHPGWYGEAGFTVTARGRDDYRAKLSSDWWTTLDPADVERRARLFAGWYFAVPDWQAGYVYPDDSEQDPIYRRMPAFLARHRAAIAREADELRAWFEADDPFFHIFKMARAERFVSVAGEDVAEAAQ